MRFSVNQRVLNKNLDPQTQEVHANYKAWTQGWQEKHGSIFDFLNFATQGYGVSGAVYKKGYRNKAQFIEAQLILLDIDNTKVVVDPENPKNKIKVPDIQLTIDGALEHPLFKNHGSGIYTSPSHTDSHPRFRLVFVLPEIISDYPLYEEIVNQLIQAFGADSSCKDVSRGFYGNNAVDSLVYCDTLDKKRLDSQIVDIAIASLEQKQKAKADRIAQKNNLTFERNKDELLKQAKDALAFIPQRKIGSNNYAQSMRVLAAVAHTFDETTATALIEEWSPTIPETTWNVPYKVNSFRGANYNDETLGIGTLFYIARQHGYKGNTAKTKVSLKGIVEPLFAPDDIPQDLDGKAQRLNELAETLTDLEFALKQSETPVIDTAHFVFLEMGVALFGYPCNSGFNDYSAFAGAGTPPPPPCLTDIDGNGATDFQDLVQILSNYGPCPE